MGDRRLGEIVLLAGHKLAIVYEKPPLLILPLFYANSARTAYLSCNLSLIHYKYGIRAQICSVQFPVNAQSLAELCRAADEILKLLASSSSFHQRYSIRRFQCPDQDCGRLSFFLGHQIQAMVNPIGDVDVCISRVSEHYFVSGGHTPVGMAGRIFETDVGLRLHDLSGKKVTVPVDHQVFSQKLPCHLERGTIIEFSVEFSSHRIALFQKDLTHS